MFRTGALKSNSLHADTACGECMRSDFINDRRETGMVYKEALTLPSTPASAVRISVVVPCYNEAEGVHECHARLSRVLAGITDHYEIVYVDDGSRDGTLRELRAIHDADVHVTVIELSRNFGHQIAVSAGLDAARGQAVVIIDADLQDPPEVIKEMVDVWNGGYDVVYGVREVREGESNFKLWTAKAFYRLINVLADIDIPLDTGDFRLLDRKAVDALRSLPERHRLLRGMCSWIGFRQIGVKYARAPRFAGKTKYPVRKMLALALDGISSFSTMPLRIVTTLGFLSAGISALGIIYALVIRLVTQSWVAGWTISFIGMLFLGGLQMISMGIVGEYVGRIYTEAKERPLYFTRSLLQCRGHEIFGKPSILPVSAQARR
jgi:polyisoprenyl-phosphate glycosyltransferase